MRNRLVAAVVVGAVVMTAIIGGSARSATPVSFNLGSGLRGAVGAPDLLTLASSNGTVYAPAMIVPPAGNYSTIAGTKWVNGSVLGGAAVPVMRYRANFLVPPGTKPTMIVYVHADNAAGVYLNGKKLGGQRLLPIVSNFQSPAEKFYAKPSRFKVGLNTLQFNVANFGGPAGLNYLAKVTLATV